MGCKIINEFEDTFFISTEKKNLKNISDLDFIKLIRTPSFPIQTSISFEKAGKDINLDKIPLCTKDAIQYAMLKSIILPIKEVSLNKNIIFTGGDGELLSKYFENSVYKKDLIFENMKRIIDANNCIA